MRKNLLLLLVTMLSTLGAFAQPAGWSYRLPIIITENSGTTLYNYQVKITLNTQALVSAGQMDPSGNDIRFGNTCAGTSFYPYWIESGMNTASTIVWVKVDTLVASSSKTIYLYHGNPSATSSSSLSIFSGPHSATDSVSGANTGGVGDSQRGFRFSPNEDILMTHFGKNEPTGTTRYITLFDFASQAILSQLQVSGPAAGYSYGTVANPMWLTSGTQYLLIIHQGASDGYYFGAAPQAGQHITYYDMRYCNGCSENTFPTNSLGGMHYGYVDMLYYTRQHASADPTATPGTGTLTVAGGTTSVCTGSSLTLSPSVTGGSMPYTYQWSPAASLSSTTVSNPVATPSAATTYSLTVTDGGGCTASSTVDVSLNPLPVVNLGPDVTACNGDMITLDAGNAGATFAWSTTQSSQAISVMSTGTYNVTVLDANGCTSSDTVMVMFNPNPVVSLGPDVIQCGGSVMLDAGNAGAVYQWQDASAAQTLNATATGTYSVTVTDANGCSGMDVVDVTINALPSVSLGSDIAVCTGDSVMLDAGNAGSSFAWNTTETTQAIIVIAAGSYDVTVTDANSCSNSDTIVVMYNANPVVSLGSDVTQCGGSVTLNAGNAGATYQWQDASAGQTFNASSTGTYYVSVMDANGCSGNDTVNVTINAIPSVTLSLPNDTVCLNWGTFNLTGGTPFGGSYTGTGVGAGAFTPSMAGVGTHVITYTYLDSNGCSASATQNMFVDPCTGIEELAPSSIAIYPNPSSGMVTLVFDAEKARMQVFTPDMRRIIDQEVNGKSEVSLDLSGYAKGIYFVVVQSATTTMTNKIVIQ